MFNHLGRLTTSHPRLCCAAWLVVGAVLSLVAPSWDGRAQDDDICFLPERCASVRGYQLLSQAFPQDVFASRAIFAVERPDAPLTSADFGLVDRLAAELEDLRAQDPSLRIGKIISYRDGVMGSRLTSDDGRCTLLQASLGTPFLAIQTRATVDLAESRLRGCLAQAGRGAPRLLTTGPAGLGRDLTRASASGLESTTLATILLVIAVLLLVYRAPFLALIPLATIAVSVWVSLKLLALLSVIPGFHLMSISRVFAVVILYGAGTDYCLFLISRYQENLANGHRQSAAIARAVRAVGGALTASAGTVICGLGLMGFAEFAKVRCAGPAIALSLAVALLASLTLTPALLQVTGRWVFWPLSSPRPGARVHSHGLRGPAGASDPLWERLSRSVVARPRRVLLAAALVLAPLAILGLRVEPHYRPTGELSPETASLQGLTAIQRHFTAGEVGPLTVLLESPSDWTSPSGRRVIAHLSQGLASLSNVAEVRSLTQPLGTPLSASVSTGPRAGLLGGLLNSFRRDVDQAITQVGDAAARQFYVARVPAAEATPARQVTRLDVVLRSDPFEQRSKETLGQVQEWLRTQLPADAAALGEVRAECYGATVNAVDLAEITESDRARVNALVLTGIFLILLALVRRLWLAAYLLATVLFTYFATLGATALAGMLWSGRPLDEVDWRVPFFLFTILVAVGEDYNIFLVTRMLQERKRYGTVEGIRRALAGTGGTITSCGLIMAGTFATLMLSRLGTLVQIGFALALGVLLDTFLVRPFLVPAFALVVWQQWGRTRTAAREIQRLVGSLRRAG